MEEKNVVVYGQKSKFKSLYLKRFRSSFNPIVSLYIWYMLFSTSIKLGVTKKLIELLHLITLHILDLVGHLFIVLQLWVILI